MPSRYLVIGAAGHAQEVAWSAREASMAAGRSCELFFFDDRVPSGPLPSGLGDVVGTLDAVAAHVTEDAALVMGVALPRLKVAVVERLASIALPWATIVHPRATIGLNVSLGLGCYVAAGALVTVNVRLGKFVTVNMHAQVAHDGWLGDFVTLHPDAHLSGGVRIEDGCEIGTGAAVLPGVHVGSWAVLGAGCVAPRSLIGGATHVGVPARVLARRMRRVNASPGR